MTKCPKCGFENSGNSICIQCGMQLNKEETKPSSNQQVNTNNNYQEQTNQNQYNQNQYDQNQMNYNQVDANNPHYYPTSNNNQENNYQNNQYQQPQGQYYQNPADNINYKSPALAAFFGIFLSGGGYIYLGRWADGILMIILCIILGFFTWGIGSFILAVYGIYDSYKKAKIHNKGQPIPSLEYSLKHIFS